MTITHKKYLLLFFHFWWIGSDVGVQATLTNRCKYTALNTETYTRKKFEEYVVSGYFRESSIEVPNDIQRCCLSFYQEGPSFFEHFQKIGRHKNDLLYRVLYSENMLFCVKGNKIYVQDRKAKSTYKLSGHVDDCSRLFYTNGLLFIGGFHCRRIGVWSLKEKKCIHTFEEQGGLVSDFCYGDRAVFLLNAFGIVNVFSLKEKKFFYEFILPYNRVLSICYGDKMLFSGNMDGTINVHNFLFEHNTTLKGHGGPIRSLRYIAGILWSAGDDHTIRIWNPKTGKCIHILKGHSSPIHSLCYDDGDGVILSGSARMVKVWSLKAKKCIYTFEGYKDDIRKIFYEDGMLLTVGYDKIRVWGVPRRTRKINLMPTSCLIC